MKRFMIVIVFASAILSSAHAGFSSSNIVDSIRMQSNLTASDVYLQEGLSKRVIAAGLTSAVIALKWARSKAFFESTKDYGEGFFCTYKNKSEDCKPLLTKVSAMLSTIKDYYWTSRSFKLGRFVMNSGFLAASIGAGYGAYTWYKNVQTPVQALEKVEKYVQLCDSLAVATHKYETIDALKDGLVVARNNAWIGRSSLEVYNGICNVMQQAECALALLELIQDSIEDKAALNSLYEKINCAMACLEHNYSLLRKVAKTLEKDEYALYKKFGLQICIARDVLMSSCMVLFSGMIILKK